MCCTVSPPSVSYTFKFVPPRIKEDVESLGQIAADRSLFLRILKRGEGVSVYFSSSLFPPDNPLGPRGFVLLAEKMIVISSVHKTDRKWVNTLLFELCNLERRDSFLSLVERWKEEKKPLIECGCEVEHLEYQSARKVFYRMRCWGGVHLCTSPAGHLLSVIYISSSLDIPRG